MAEHSVTINLRPPRAGGGTLPNADPYKNRSGFWGTVTAVHPESLTVDVIADIGREFFNLRVATKEWVTVVKDQAWITGERDLPPVDTLVYCVMPTGAYSDAFVLCSGYVPAAVHSQFKGAGDGFARTRAVVTAGGWDILEDKDTGALSIQNKKKQSLMITIKEDRVEVGAFNTSISINGEGVAIGTAGKAVWFAGEDDDRRVEGNAKNHITGDAEYKTMGSEKKRIEGDYAFTVLGTETKRTGGEGAIVSTKDMKLESKEGKFSLLNADVSFHAMLKELIKVLKNVQTFGSSANHKMAPDTIQALTQFEMDFIDKLFFEADPVEEEEEEEDGA